MTPTPKELLESATNVIMASTSSRSADTIAKHILDNVRVDDDEPVEGEYLESISHLCWPSNPAIRECKVHYYRFVWWKETAGVWRLSLSFCGVEMSVSEVATRGQFRTLCRVLGITLPEVQE